MGTRSDDRARRWRARLGSVEDSEIIRVAPRTAKTRCVARSQGSARAGRTQGGAHEIEGGGLAQSGPKGTAGGCRGAGSEDRVGERLASGDDRAGAAPGGHQARSLQLLVGPAHRVGGEAEVGGQDPDRRKALTLGQGAADDVTGELGSDLLVRWLGRREVDGDVELGHGRAAGIGPAVPLVADPVPGSATRTAAGPCQARTTRTRKRQTRATPIRPKPMSWRQSRGT